MVDFLVYEANFDFADFKEGVILEPQNKIPIINMWIGY